MAMSLHKRISFDSIESIEFEEDQLTNFRRIDPRFQLNCLGEHCDQYGFERVECSKKKDLPKTDDERNQLINYQSSHWDCFAFYTNLNDSEENLLLVDDQFRFACEGWRHDQDAFILQGSCSLNYTFISEKTSQNQITTTTPSGYKNGL
ncbi:hypothetical protein DFH28DRAFT_1078632 [Melampsora americana]|nr:hypothetical protein DFH28DRAFT_1078632 [Melampsora americana]